MCPVRANIILIFFLSLDSCGEGHNTLLPSSIDIPLTTGPTTYLVKNVPGDGNCFYHAIANNPKVHKNHQALRELAAVTFIHLFETNKPRVMPYILSEKLDPNDDATKTTIAKKIRKLGNWGGHFESVLLEEALNTSIHIYNYATKTWIFQQNMKEDDIFIFYNGTNHYLALERTN